MVSEVLKRNDYPENVINKCIKDVKIKMGLLRNTQENNDTRNKSEQPPTKKSYLCLPYVSEQHKRKTMYILRKTKQLGSTKVTFTPEKKLSELLVSSKLQHVMLNLRKNVTNVTTHVCQNLYVMNSNAPFAGTTMMGRRVE